MFYAPLNNVVVKIDTKYIANLSNMLRAAAINPGSQINPADYVNIHGEVVSVPKAISKKLGYDGFSVKDIKPGDRCIVRYDLVFDFEEVANGAARYKNLVTYKAQEFWLCDIQKLHAVIRGEEIIMVNGYCMIEHMTPPSQIVLPQSMKRQINAASGILTHIGNNLSHLPNIDAEAGDTVFFNPHHLSVYQVHGKKFGIIFQRQILGKRASPHEEFKIIN